MNDTYAVVNKLKHPQHKPADAATRSTSLLLLLLLACESSSALTADTFARTFVMSPLFRSLLEESQISASKST